MLKDGDAVPRLILDADDGAKLALPPKGRPLVLYFYPKDDTSGCTAEAKDFNTLAAEFHKAGVDLAGISPDGIDSHLKFKAKHGLAIRLAADPEKTAAEAFGVWVEKSMYGRRYMGVDRSTFIIDGRGRIVRSWRKVKVPGHAEEVLAVARQLTGGQGPSEVAASDKVSAKAARAGAARNAGAGAGDPGAAAKARRPRPNPRPAVKSHSKS